MKWRKPRLKKSVEDLFDKLRPTTCTYDIHQSKLSCIGVVQYGVNFHAQKSGWYPTLLKADTIT